MHATREVAHLEAPVHATGKECLMIATTVGAVAVGVGARVATWLTDCLSGLAVAL